MRVFINPGHAPDGNPDPGACGNGLRESDVVAEVGAAVAGHLEKAGCTVELLQSDSLSEISNTSNAWDADVFVSIHCNSAANDDARGVETWSYPYSVNGAKLAQCIQDQIAGELANIDEDFPDRGCKAANFHVVRETDAVACLVELAFINNAEDALLLKEYTDNFARAIARGVTDYENL